MGRYTFRYASNRHEKIRRNQIYEVKLSNGYAVTFQEQGRETTETGAGVHTHIWLTHSDLQRVGSVWQHVTESDSYLPHRTHSFALVTAYRRSEGNPEEFEPGADFELVVDRKLSQTLVDEATLWLDLVIEVADTRVAIRTLFGEAE